MPPLTLAGPAPSPSADFLALSSIVSASLLCYLAVCCLLNLGLGPCGPRESFHLYFLPHQWKCGQVALQMEETLVKTLHPLNSPGPSP